jgi:hypothetical protein
MHGWNPKLIEREYPFWIQALFKMNPDGTATLKNDVLLPDANYGFFAALAAEVGDTKTLNAILKTCDSAFSPVWQDGTYHYPFMDKVATVNLAAGDSDKKAPEAAPSSAPQVAPVAAPAAKSDAKGGFCCKAMQMKEQKQGCANNMKTMPQHSDVFDKMIALARACPKSGIFDMHNKPFDAAHFTEPYVTGIDIAKVPLKRAVYDAKKKALIVSTSAAQNPCQQTFILAGLDKAMKYSLKIDGVDQEKIGDCFEMKAV